MSYVPQLVGNARRRIHALPTEVQEAVYDFLERLAADASPADATVDVVAGEHHVFVYRGDAGEFTVYMDVDTDHLAQAVTCPSLWYVARLADGT